MWRKVRINCNNQLALLKYERLKGFRLPADLFRPGRLSLVSARCALTPFARPLK